MGHVALQALLHFLTWPWIQLHSSFVCCSACFPWMLSVSSLSQSISLFVCLSNILPLHLFFSFLSPSLSYSPNLLCPRVPKFTLYLVLKDGISHILVHLPNPHILQGLTVPELCQPFPIRFMNHFLFNISITHTCAASTQIVPSSLLLLSLSLGDIKNSRYSWHDLGPGFLCCVEGQRPTGLPLSIFSIWTRVL